MGKHQIILNVFEHETAKIIQFHNDSFDTKSNN
jgi:hypothetical protein